MSLDIHDWKEFPLNSLFTICRGNGFSKANMDDDPNGINFVSRQSQNNGVSGQVARMADVSPFPAGTLTVALGGEYLGSTFVQTKPYYTAAHIGILTPKNEMPLLVKLFISKLIRLESSCKYQAFGRELDTHIDKEFSIKLPSDAEGKPDFIRIANMMEQLHVKPLQTAVKSQHLSFDTKQWGQFYLHDLFNIRMGNGFDNNKMTDENPSVNLVSRTSSNNGVSWRVDVVKGVQPFESGLITVALGGSIGASFVQVEPFYTGQNVAVLKAKKEIPLRCKLFVTRLIEFESSIRYQTFGRELNAHIKRDFTVTLPQTSEGEPDWEWMEEFIKSLPYSDRISYDN